MACESVATSVAASRHPSGAFVKTTTLAINEWQCKRRLLVSLCVCLCVRNALQPSICRIHEIKMCARGCTPGGLSRVRARLQSQPLSTRTGERWVRVSGCESLRWHCLVPETIFQMVTNEQMYANDMFTQCLWFIRACPAWDSSFFRYRSISEGFTGVSVHPIRALLRMVLFLAPLSHALSLCKASQRPPKRAIHPHAQPADWHNWSGRPDGGASKRQTGTCMLECAYAIIKPRQLKQRQFVARSTLARQFAAARQMNTNEPELAVVSVAA